MFAHVREQDVRGMERGLLFSVPPHPHCCGQAGAGSGSLLGFFPQAPQAAEASCARALARRSSPAWAPGAQGCQGDPITCAASKRAAGECTPAGLCCVLPGLALLNTVPTRTYHRRARSALAARIARQLNGNDLRRIRAPAQLQAGPRPSASHRRGASYFRR